MRQQLNEVSGYLDMGLVYGNSHDHLEAIRGHTSKLLNKFQTKIFENEQDMYSILIWFIDLPKTFFYNLKTEYFC